MDELQLQELLEKLIPAVKDGVMGDVNKALNGLSAKLQKPLKKGDDDSSDTKEDASILAIKTELTALKATLENEKKQNITLARKAALAPYLTKTIKPDIAVKLLDEEISDIATKGEDGNWYVKEGESVVSLDKYVSTYLDSDKGSWLKQGIMTKSTEIKAKNTFTQHKTTETDSDKQFTAILEQAGLI